MARAGGGTRAGRLTWAPLGRLPVLSPGRQHTLAQSITEAKPPEVPARPSLILPPDIDQFPFSTFISSGFQVGPPRPQLSLAGAHRSPDGSPYQAAAVYSCPHPASPLSQPGACGHSCLPRKIFIEPK